MSSIDFSSNIDHTQEPFVAVLGLHSSGSSCLAGVLYHMGVHMGNKFCGYYGADPRSDNCGFEAIGLRNICESALPFPANEFAIERGRIYQRLSRFLNEKRREAVQQNTIAGGKYPQLCALGPQLKDICKEHLRILVSDRPLQESIESLKRRKPNLPEQDIEDHQQWLFERREALLGELNSWQVHRIDYHELLDQPRKIAGEIATWLKLKCDDTHFNAVVSWVQPRKRHVFS